MQVTIANNNSDGDSIQQPVVMTGIQTTFVVVSFGKCVEGLQPPRSSQRDTDMFKVVLDYADEA